MEITQLLLSFLIGLGVGLASSFLGLGGGVLIVPLLPLATGISARGAIGTSLITVFFVSLQNAWKFHEQRRVEWKVAALIGGFAAIASFIAGRVTGLFSEAALQGGMLILLVVLALQAFLGRPFVRLQPSAQEVKRPRAPAAAFVGGFTGFLSGFTGIGGGIFIVPILSLYRWVSSDKVVPTSVATIVMTSFAGAAAFAWEELSAAPASSAATSLSSAVSMGASSATSSAATSGASSAVSSAGIPWAPLEVGLVRLDLAIAIFLGAVFTSHLGVKYQSLVSKRNRDWLIGGLLLALSFRILLTILKSL